ncbi:MAG: hypothetical protein ACLUNO_13055 [Oscillospiraceae bacterium]
MRSTKTCAPPLRAGRTSRHRDRDRQRAGTRPIMPLIVPDGAARITTTHLWLRVLRAL